MKQFLRIWLEVPEVPDMSEYVKNNDIKEAVEDAIAEAFMPEKEYSSRVVYWSRGEHKDIRGTLNRSVAKLIQPAARAEVIKAIDGLVEPESFIDKVIRRIKSKQLND